LRKKVLVRAPVLTRSGYGEHGRFVLRSLRAREDLFDVYVLPVKWGETGWMAEDDEERRWIDERIKATIIGFQQGNLQPDVSIQVTIPNEWEPMAPINIGVTAGIETTKVAPVWLERANMMDKIITISEHSKQGFVGAVYQGEHKETGQPVVLTSEKPVDIVHYPVKTYENLPELELDLDYDFNYLVVAQHGPRKNLENTIKWFIEENFDQKVGLVVKTFVKNGAIIDRLHTEKMLQNMLLDAPERKCKVYLLHGDMTDAEMHSLYVHAQIKALVSLTHGEGFGLPLFEAAYSGIPVIAPGWSGQCDFLYAPLKAKKGKGKGKKKHPYFAEVNFTMGPVPDDAVWEGVLIKESMWCYPEEGSYKMKLRDVRKNYSKWKKKAKTLQEWILENFKAADMMSNFVDCAFGKTAPPVPSEALPKISIITSVYDGDEFIRPFMEDITRQTIFEEKCELIMVDANSPGNEEEVIKEYMGKYPNIKYKKLDADPGIYGTWNIAVNMSDGDYITNANLDDRKALDSLEVHAKELYSNPEIDLVYADSYITNKPNEMFENNTSEGRKYNFEQFSKEAMLRGNQPHNNPMWRKSLHDKHGMFNDKYRSAGDWEFFLRCAVAGSEFRKIQTPLGLYYFNPKGISTNFENFSWKQEEETEIYDKYKDLAKSA